VDRNRGFFGFDAMLVSGAAAESLNLPQSGGFLVKQVAKDSVAERLGLKGGNRMGIVDGRQLVVGGDILLLVQGIAMASADDRAAVFRKLETIHEGEDVRVTVFRDGKIVELATVFTGF
jgi:serine protease Do